MHNVLYIAADKIIGSVTARLKRQEEITIYELTHTGNIMKGYTK